MAAPIRNVVYSAATRWVSGSLGWFCRPRGLSVSAAARSKWKLFGALCLQRPPSLTQAMTPEETEMAELVQQLEMEKSLYSDHELRCLAEEQRLQRKKDHYDEDWEDTRKEIVLVQDVEEMWEHKFQNFKHAPRRTDADEADDQTSLNRKLDQNLLLLIKQKIGDQEIWLLPQVEWKVGESLRATAERVLASLSGSVTQAQFLGNAPCGFYKYKFPRAVQTEDCVGAKVFFFKALLQDSHLSLPKGKVDYRWVCKGELTDYLEPKYHSRVSRFLVDV